MPSVYFISGGGRGLGLGLVQALAATSDAIVFAGARDPAGKDLAELASAYPDKVFPVALHSGDVASAEAAAKYIEQTAGKLDVVIANAGIGKVAATSDIIAEDLMEAFKVNTLGPLVLFQQTQHLLRKGSAVGKFATVSSAQGSIANMLPGPTGAYGVTKAAVNYMTVKLQAENQDLIIFPICPGFTATPTALAIAKDSGAPDEFLGLAAPVDVTVARVLKHVQDTVKLDNPTTFWCGFGPQQIAF